MITGKICNKYSPHISLVNVLLFPKYILNTWIINKIPINPVWIDVNIKNIKGKIVFKNVKFAYSDVEEIETKNKKGKVKKELKHNKKEPIFNNLSFTINPNTTVAFVGKSAQKMKNNFVIFLLWNSCVTY